MPHQNPSLSLPPPEFTALEKARWHIRAQNTRAALTCLNQLLATTDPPAEAYRLRGWVHHELQAPQAARRDLLQAVELDPHHPANHLFLGLWLLDVGKLQWGIAQLQLVFTTPTPADTATQLSAHLGCQYAYALLGHWAAAVVELQAARGLHPQRCMVYAGGQLYWRLTRSPEAEEDFNHLAARDRANLTDREPPPPSELACLTPWEILTALQFPLVLPA